MRSGGRAVHNARAHDELAVAELQALFTAIHRQLRQGASGQAAEAVLALARGAVP